MFRITSTTREDQTPVLLLEGKLNKQGAAELQQACQPMLRQYGRLMLDLSGLSFVDTTAAAFLQELKEHNVRIRGCSPLVRELLKEAQQ